ncbi:unnamed protein product [Ascophyllum nodosum]
MISGAGVVDEFDNQLNDAGQYDNPQDPASLSLVEHIRALSVRGKLTLVYIVFVLIYLLFRKGWVLAFVTAVAFAIAAAPLFVWWSRIRFSCPLDLVVRSFGLGLIVMFWVVMIVNRYALMFAMFLLGVNYQMGLVLLVGIEEMFKVILVFWSKRDVAIGRETKAHQIATTATSLGYAVGFTFIMVILLDGSWDALENIKPGSLDDLVVAIMCLIITTLFGTPMHVLSGYLIGLEVTRQTHFMKVGLFPFLLRSLFMLNIMLWLDLFDRVIISLTGLLITNALICAVMVYRIKRVESTLPVEYLQRVGYLQAFGYGVLPGGDVDEVEVPSTVDVNNLV